MERLSNQDIIKPLFSISALSRKNEPKTSFPLFPYFQKNNGIRDEKISNNLKLLRELPENKGLMASLQFFRIGKINK